MGPYQTSLESDIQRLLCRLSALDHTDLSGNFLGTGHRLFLLLKSLRIRSCPSNSGFPNSQTYQNVSNNLNQKYLPVKPVNDKKLTGYFYSPTLRTSCMPLIMQGYTPDLINGLWKYKISKIAPKYCRLAPNCTVLANMCITVEKSVYYVILMNNIQKEGVL